MRACWESLHGSFVRSVTTLRENQNFRIGSAGDPVLARFESPAGLIEYLTTKSVRNADHDQKNDIYAALVRAVQARGARAELASALLWCGLWPALDGIYRHRLRHFSDEPEELVAALCAAFTCLVGRMDLDRVNQIAATLVRSTDRDLMDARRRDRGEHDHLVANGDIESARGDRMSPICTSLIGIHPGLSARGRMVALRGWLLDVAGEDADLVLALLVFEEPPRLAAARLGMSHATARKRVQRALTHVREHFQKSLSHFADETRVSQG